MEMQSLIAPIENVTMTEVARSVISVSDMLNQNARVANVEAQKDIMRASLRILEDAVTALKAAVQEETKDEEEEDE